MRMILLGLVTAALMLFSICAPICAKLAEEDIVGLWLFDEGKGDTAADLSENVNDGEINTAKWVDGKYGKALSFDKSTTGFIAPDSESLNIIEAITVVAWVKYDDMNMPADWPVIVCKNPVNASYILFYQTQFEQFRFRLNIGGFQTVNSTTAADVDKWYHVAGTYDGKELRIYVNGVEEASLPQQGEFAVSAGPLSIGFLSDGSAQTLGIIDEVLIANRALTEAEIKELMLRSVSGVLSVESSSKLAATWAEIKNIH